MAAAVADGRLELWRNRAQVCAPEHTPNIQGRRGAGVENGRRDLTVRDSCEVSVLSTMCAAPGLVLSNHPITGWLLHYLLLLHVWNTYFY